MKVVRLARGYVIRLNDGEFEALSDLVAHGQADAEGADDFDVNMSPAAKRAFRSDRFQRIGSGVLDVDVDRRGSKP